MRSASIPTFALAVALFSALTAAAQQQPATTTDTSDFRVEGTVLDGETGQPLANARLEIGSGPFCANRPESSATTGDDGTFRIPLMSGGRYTVCIRRDGYLLDRSQRLSQCSPCTPTYRLHVAAGVSGRILTEDTKDTLNRVAVEAIRVSDSFSIATSATVNSVRSGPNGQFSLDQLLPGQYFFRFTPAYAAPLLVDDGQDATAKQLMVQWWPGGDSPHGATPFTILAGTNLRIPDIWLHTVPRYRVSGTVQATICQAGDPYTISIGEHRGASVAMIRSMIVRCGADFTFGDLSPGRYEVSLLPKDGGGPVAKEEAVIVDRNLQRDFPLAQATP